MLEAITAILAGVVAWSSVKQWWVAKEALRLELFDRRMTIFDAARKFIASITIEGRVDSVEQNRFLAATADSQFFFGSGVQEYLNVVYRKSLDLHLHAVSQENAGPDRASHIQKEADLMNWFAEQLRPDAMPALFAPYMAFHGK